MSTTHSSSPMEPVSLSRRTFLKNTAVLSSAAIAFPAIVRGQNLNSAIHVGVIGAGGKGSSDTDETAKANKRISKSETEAVEGSLNASIIKTKQENCKLIGFI